MVDFILTQCLQAEDLSMCCRCTFVSATSIFFNVIPVIRIVYGVFPFNPNRWFGIGFLVYYSCFTPLLYQVSPGALTRDLIQHLPETPSCSLREADMP
jgi:hypothetical protein